MKRLLDWINDNAKTIEPWLGYLFFGGLFMACMAIVAAKAMGY